METTRCDRCSGVIHSPDDLRYSITIEIEAEGHVDQDQFDSTEDQLSKLEELIDSADDACSADFGDEWYQMRQYLVCKGCYSQFIQNPLGKPTK